MYFKDTYNAIKFYFGNICKLLYRYKLKKQKKISSKLSISIFLCFYKICQGLHMFL